MSDTSDREELARGQIAWVLNNAGMEGPDRLKYADAIITAGWLSPAAVTAKIAEAKAEAWSEGHLIRQRFGPDDCPCSAWNEDECGCGLYNSGEIVSLDDNPYRPAAIRRSRENA